MNAPPSFQRYMDTMLSGLTGVCCLVYIDDIIIYSETFEQHLRDLQNVFDRIRGAQMYMKVGKCKFLRRELTYLGHVVSINGIQPDPKKTEVIREMQPPKNVVELRRFLDLRRSG